MVWWVWLIAVVVVVGLLGAAVLGVQARRRSGGVIVVRRGRRPGRGRVR
ncbi:MULTISPECIES: hypothetical protein [unclassified Streptomyces]|nr:hypothetical protein [Streptomyces sp. Je 1-369]WAL98803.1 hypothetical protein NOO62_32610 [Streptomyces sp. Je 1-369]